jgi:hypothetical protein
MIDKVVVPKFATEAGEADWWYQNREAHGAFMAQEMAASRTMKMSELLAQRALVPDKTPVYLDIKDVGRAREQAKARGVDAESYLNGLVHQAIERNDAA